MKKNVDRNLKLLEVLKKLQLSDSEGDQEEKPMSSNQGSGRKEFTMNSSNSSSVHESSNAILQSKYNRLKAECDALKEKENCPAISNSRRTLSRPMTSNPKAQNQASFKQQKPVLKENLQLRNEAQPMERPKTASRFQPVYTESYSSFLISNKCFNYKDKNFITVKKKTDIVAKFQNFKKGWEKTKFLKNNSTNGKEGRKLNLAQRISNDKPEEMFYRYVPKAGLY